MEVVLANSDLFIRGILTTLRLVAVSGIAAFALGMVLAVMQVSPVPILQKVGVIYTQIFRNIPSTVHMFFTAFVLPALGVSASFFSLAALAISLYYSAYFGEVIRSGILSVPSGEIEGAKSLGLGFRPIVRYIIAPQALRRVVPPLISTFVAVVKVSAIAGAFGVMELFGTLIHVVNVNDSAVLMLLAATAVFYSLITIPFALIAGRLEKRLAFTTR